MKEFFIKVSFLLVAILWLGGSICTLITICENAKAIIPIAAAVVIVVMGIPTLVSLFKKVSKNV